MANNKIHNAKLNGAYQKGAIARSKGVDKSACPFHGSAHRCDRSLWFGGWNDRDDDLRKLKEDI